MTKAETLAKEKESNGFDFQKDLSINKFRLDEECLSHSGRYAFYAEAQGRAKSEVSKAKDNLEFVEAEANLRIRKEYLESGAKVTEGTISSRISTDEEVLEAKKQVREAEEVFGRLSVAVSAMDTRRSELDNLVKLYCAGYYSTVNSNERKNSSDQASMEARKNLNK